MISPWTPSHPWKLLLQKKNLKNYYVVVTEFRTQSWFVFNPKLASHWARSPDTRCPPLTKLPQQLQFWESNQCSFSVTQFSYHCATGRPQLLFNLLAIPKLIYIVQIDMHVLLKLMCVRMKSLFFEYLLASTYHLCESMQMQDNARI